MQYILLAVIFLQMAVLVYMDYQNRQEREKLERKLMSRDLTEYEKSVEPEPEPMKQEEEDHIPIEDVSVDQLMKAEDTR